MIASDIDPQRRGIAWVSDPRKLTAPLPFALDQREQAAFVSSIGYRRSTPRVKPKLGPFTVFIDAILAKDKGRPKKQQHTSKWIFERLRDEHAFTGGITIVKDYGALCRQHSEEMFVPLVHPPGHAQVDFGQAIGIIGGEERKIHFFAFDLPHSDACFCGGVSERAWRDDAAVASSDHRRHSRLPYRGARGASLACNHCCHEVFSYHSCRYRSCPKCHTDQTKAWLVLRPGFETPG